MKTKQRSGLISGVCSMLWSLLTSVCVSMLGAVILTFLITGETLSLEVTQAGSLLIGLVASAAGACMAAVLCKDKHLVWCLGAGGCYFAFQLLMNLLLTGGQMGGMISMLFAILAGSGLVGVVAMRTAGKRGPRRRRYRF